jgi:hypothetical protein
MDSPKTMHKMVVHKADGVILKGVSHNFSPFAEIFHLELNDIPPGENKCQEVRMIALKAVFLVKCFEGHSDYKDKKCFQDPGIIMQPGRKAQVEFIDGEKMFGMIFTFDPRKTGFWLFPLDPNDNNERIFVINNCVKEVIFI